MNFIAKKHLSRRTVLRGLGVTMALPFLDSMVPAHTALARTAAHPPLRLGFCFIPHGAVISEWTPVTEGSHWELSRNLAPLKNVKDQVVVLTNLNLNVAESHAGTPPAFLSGTACRKIESLDQILVQALRQSTRLPSLELGTEDFDGFSDTSLSTISWRSPTEPLPVEIDPRAVFNRLFGKCRGILDEVLCEVKSLQSGLGASDNNRLADYLDNVRDIERRIHEVPDHVERTRLMFDLMALAWQADITRVQTFMMAREVSYRAFPHIGAPEPFHVLSHHQFDPVKWEHFINVNTYHVSQVARFLERIKNTPDGDGSLLDHSLFMYGSGMGLANSHQHDALPIILAGGANGQLRGNRHLKYPEETPLANLLLSIADKAGVHLDSLGDSTGRLEGI